MTKYISILICFFMAVAMQAQVVKSAHAATKSMQTVSVGDVAGGETYASVSKSNPFEVIPAAGMELIEDLSHSDNVRMVPDMIAFAKKYLGVRYVRGGRSPKGFDCSGFTSYVFGQFGISLSPASRTQATQGEKINREEVEAGDLIFFTGRNATSGVIGHVGMVIDYDYETGEITFIHAASRGISIDKLNQSAYYSKRFVEVRRVL